MAAMAANEPGSREPSAGEDVAGPGRRYVRIDVRAIRPAPMARWIRLTLLGCAVLATIVIYATTMLERRSGRPTPAASGAAHAPSGKVSVILVRRPAADLRPLGSASAEPPAASHSAAPVR